MTAYSQTISTIAGSGISGYFGDGGQATNAQISVVFGLAVDKKGNIFISDDGNSRLRKVDLEGTMSTLAGTGVAGYGGDTGPATLALLNQPKGIAADKFGNVYVGDASNYRIRKIDGTGIITTFAGTGVVGSSGDGGPATNAKVQNIAGVATDSTGNVYIGAAYLRKISTGGIITTVAGQGLPLYGGDGGPATACGFSGIGYVFVDGPGRIYTSEGSQHLRQINTHDTINTIAGNGIAGDTGDGGPATAAEIIGGGMGVDAAGNVFFAESSSRVRIVSAAGIINTFAGTGVNGFSGDGGPATAAQFDHPSDVAVDCAGNVLVADKNNYRIRKIDRGLNHLPSFAGGHSQALIACDNVARNIDTLLQVADADTGQYETWQVISQPHHGAAAASYSASVSGVVMPVGLHYTSVMGYSGMDTFVVAVYDCARARDTTTIYVAVHECSLAAISAAAPAGGLRVSSRPASGSFACMVETPNDEPAVLSVSDMAGHLISRLTITTNVTTEVSADMPNGIYLISAQTRNGSWNARVAVLK